MGPPPLKKRSRREDRVEEILAAARELLETKGLVGSTIADVAAQAGVSEATVFSYFRTRRHLMFRVISDWMEPAIRALEADLLLVKGVQARLEFFAARHLREMAASPGMHQLIYRELHWEDYYGSVLHRLNQRFTGIVIWIIEEGKAGGEVSPEVDAGITRDLLFGALHHIGWRTLLNDRAINIEATAVQVIGQLFSGIRSGPPAERLSAGRLDTVVARLERVADRLGGRG